MLALWLTLVVCTVAGCGGATHVPISGPSTATAGVARPVSPTKAQAAAYASAVNLRAADLPNMRITKAEHRAARREQIDQALAHCLGTAGLRKSIARIASPTFTGETEGEYEYELIASDVEIQPSEAIADANDAPFGTAHGLSCVRHFASISISKASGGIGYAPLEVVRLADPLPAITGSFGLRFETAIVSLPESTERVHFPFYIDVFGFASGAADIYLTDVGAPGPVPTEAEQRLISLLYSRASATHL